MKNILLNLYYDNYTIEEAKSFIERCYGETPSNKTIEKVVAEIKSQTNKEWR